MLRTGKIKPKVAFRAQENAKENIEAKLLLIYKITGTHSATIALEGLEKARATELLVKLPRSVRQFNAWTGPDVFPYDKEFVRPKRNAQETLHNCDLLEKVQEATKLVDSLCAELEKPSPKVERLAAAIRRARIAEELRGISERMLVEVKRDNESLKRCVADLEIQIKSLRRESQALASKLDALIWKKNLDASVESSPGSNVSSLRSK